MKSIYLKLSAAGLLLGATTFSCSEEFLETIPLGQFSTVGLENVQGVEGVLLGAYAMIDGFGLDGQAGWNGTIDNWVYGGVVSDDAYKGTDAGDQPEQSFLETFDFQATNLHLRNKWRAVYKGVARANDALNTPIRILGDAADFISLPKIWSMPTKQVRRGFLCWIHLMPVMSPVTKALA